MSEYYSVIQLLATLAIGFVILGYSDFFIETLKKNFFRANDIILEIENECMKIIPDNDTLNGLEITNVGDGNTEEQIKELKRKCDEMKTNKIPSFNKESEEYLYKICILNSLAPMSLFVFMYTTILLIIPGLTYEYLIDFLTIFSLFCGIYMFLGWIFGEKDCKKPLNFRSMSHPIVCFIAILIISFVLSLFCKDLPITIKEFIEDKWKCFTVILIIIGWLNFIMYAIFIKYKIYIFNKKIGENKEPLLSECKLLRDECDKLIAVMEVAKLTNNTNNVMLSKLQQKYGQK